MRATALVVAELRNGRTVITDLRSEAPMALRETARGLSMVGSAAGPVGGDELSMTVRIGQGASLCIEAVAATMVFPHSSGARSSQRLEIDIEAGGHLRWVGQPLLVIAGGDHQQRTAIRLADGATLDFVDEVALGRTNEDPGRLDAHLRIERAGLPLIDQRQIYDPADPAWSTSAGLGGFRHVRHHLVVGRGAEVVATVVEPTIAAARMPLAPDVELAITLGADRCAGAD